MSPINQIFLFFAGLADKAIDEVLGLAIGFLIVKLIERLYKERKFGGWILRVIGPDGEVVTERKIGMRKAEDVLDDDSSLSVYAKGVVSPHATLTVDLVTRGREIGLLEIDKKHKLILVDLRRNPPAAPKANPRVS